MTKACTVCTKNGYPNEQINFDKIGEDPTTGKIKWKLTNADGTEHKHKGGQQFKPSQTLEGIKRVEAKLDKLLKYFNIEN